MFNNFSQILTRFIVLIVLTTSSAMAEEAQGRFAVIFSNSETFLSAPSYMASEGFIAKDHKNSGSYYGFLGEINYGKIGLSIDYLTGKTGSVEGGLNLTAASFNPLAEQRSDTVDVSLGYNFLEHELIGKVDATLGYFRMWESKAVTPSNWYDGFEIGLKGRKTWSNGFAVTYKLGYVPRAATHGFLEDYDKMEGIDILKYRIGVEIPVYKNIAVIGGYENIRLKNRINSDGNVALVTFSGFYLGGSYSF